MAVAHGTGTEEKNCAHALEKPVQERQSREFVGLRNKGATCYLNSIIQAYYSTPEFRQGIFDMELCVNNITKRSNFVDNVNKHNFLLAFQKLFVEIQELNVSQISTEDVTKSFGWDSNEALQQQDIQEAIRVIFDGLEMALKGTIFEKKLLDHFKIETVDRIKCLNCSTTSERINIQYDLMTQVERGYSGIKDFQYIKGQTCLEESLINHQNFEKLNGDNQYFCETCNSKQDALKGTQIRHLPDILTISLMRFEFDKVKLQRCKLNDRFSFGLELDTSLFCEEVPDQIDNNLYELYSVLIHKGGAHGGHYHTFVRDFTPQKDFIRNNGINNGNHQQSEKEQLPEQNKESQMQSMEIEAQPEETTSKGKKSTRKSRYITELEMLCQSQSQPEEDSFPIIIENPQLKEGWYDIDDETVKPISVNKIQRQFGGHQDKESAYILLYRKKCLPTLSFKMPSYFSEYISQLNESHNNERAHYDAELNSIFLLSRSSDTLDLKSFKFHEDAEQTKSTKISIRWPFSKVYEAMGLSDEYSLFEVAYCDKGMIQIYQEIPWDEVKKVSDTDLQHNSEIIFVNKVTNPNDYAKMKKHCGKENVPYVLNVKKEGENMGTFVFHSQQTLRDLKQTLQYLYNVPFAQQYLKIINSGVVHQICNLPAAEEKQVADLGFQEESTIILSELSEKEIVVDSEILSEDMRYIILETNNQQPKRFIMSQNTTLEAIRQYFISSLKLDSNSKWRLKGLDDQKVYQALDYEQPLKQFLPDKFSPKEQEMRFLIEEGLIPNKEEQIITFFYFDPLIQSQTSTEVLASSTSTIKEGKDTACKQLGINPDDLYVCRVDENDKPGGTIKKETQLFFSPNLRKCTKYYLLSISSEPPTLEAEFIIYYYPTDSAEESKYLGNFILDKNKTLDEIKELIAASEKLQELAQLNNITDFNRDNIRLREMKRNHQMGGILKKSDKKFGKLISSSIEELCVQIKPEKDVLDEEDLTVLIRKRNMETLTYGENIELIIRKAGCLTISQIKQAILAKMNLTVSEDDIDIAKHFLNRFEWKEISQYNLMKHAELAQKNLKKKPKKKKLTGAAAKNQINDPEKEQEQIVSSDSGTEKYDLRKPPFSISDGDEIGWRLKTEFPEIIDDFQTEEDKENKKAFQAKKKSKTSVWQTANFDDDKGFKLNLGFGGDDQDDDNDGDQDNDQLMQDENDLAEK